MAKGEFATASESFRIALVEDPNCVPALLGQVHVVLVDSSYVSETSSVFSQWYFHLTH